MDRRTFHKALGGFALGAAAPLAFAQDYPVRPIRLVVGYPPGGANDIIARLMAQHLSEELGQQVVVDNRAGANGVIGSDAVAKAAPDGYTLLAAGMTPMVLNRLTYKKLPYNAASDFVGISEVASSPMLFAVRPDLKLRSLDDLVKLARDKPGKINFATVGSGGSTRVVFELLKQSTGVDLRYVPYKGAGAAITDILGGIADGMAVDFAALYPFVKEGKLTALAITSDTRSPLLPDVRTVAEQGHPELTCGNWYALSAPAKTPQPIVDKLHAAVAKMVQSPEMKKQLLAQGCEPKASASPQAFNQFAAAELARWGKVIKTAGIEAE
ncbi:tripartite tricarboxylate transporter substrate binding protein [Ramlibacter sp. G-1-2-2]|uniref:Tripartite tricarboxylate transporter substrate binding protein n=1 Tax=Ramlibacter agri TaxID=2728837 RepID=A0A848H9W8_9BURK|nr:tripartite tricarboxylate transporter substrate binding protein [Ramlibacter agri]NML47575.1 tripartite tricarboxylate transporter substrate binding protein [Ramlibacter agri]